MRLRLTRVERAAALAVAGMTVAVVGTGVKLLRKHAKYMSAKATAFFGTDEPASDGTDEPASDGTDEPASDGTVSAETTPVNRMPEETTSEGTDLQEEKQP